MMKRIILILLVGLLSISLATAQNREARHERIKSLKIAYITDKLQLTPDQSTKFWPLYNQMEQEQRQLRKNYMQEYKDKNPTADEKTAHQYVNDKIEFQEQELAVKKKYNEKLLKVISAQQLAELYQSEQDFKRMLLKELHNRRGGQGGRR